MLGIEIRCKGFFLRFPLDYNFFYWHLIVTRFPQFPVFATGTSFHFLQPCPLISVFIGSSENYFNLLTEESYSYANEVEMQVLSKTTSQSVRLSVSQSVSSSVSQSVRPSISQSVRLSISQSVSQSVLPSICQSGRKESEILTTICNSILSNVSNLLLYRMHPPRMCFRR